MKHYLPSLCITISPICMSPVSKCCAPEAGNNAALVDTYYFLEALALGFLRRFQAPSNV